MIVGFMVQDQPVDKDKSTLFLLWVFNLVNLVSEIRPSYTLFISAKTWTWKDKEGTLSKFDTCPGKR